MLTKNSCGGYKKIHKYNTYEQNKSAKRAAK